MKYLKQKFQSGQVSLAVAIVSAISLIAGSGITAWATANARVNSIDTKVQIVQEREENHYKELQTNLIRIEKKLDSVLTNQGR